MVTRYVVMTGGRWVTTLCGPGSGVGFTRTKEDASSWVTYECAVAAAKVIMGKVDTPVFVHSVEEPAFPRSWN